LFIFPEMATLLNLFNKYPGLKSIFTDAYDVFPITKKTKTQGDNIIEKPCFSCILASTVTWLHGNLSDQDFFTGFLARFQICSVEKPITPIAIPDEIKKNEKMERLFETLYYMDSKNLYLSKEARKFYTKWFHENWDEIKKEDKFIHSSLGRLQTVVHKLAIIFHTIDSIIYQEVEKEEYTNQIQISSYEEAVTFVNFFTENIKKVYQNIVTAPNYEELKVYELIKKLIKKSKKEKDIERVTKSNVYRYTNLKDLKVYNNILDSLVEKEKIVRTKNGKSVYIELEKE